MAEEIRCGDLVKHRITGETGIVTATFEYLSGYKRAILMALQDDRAAALLGTREKSPCDVEMLEVVERQKIVPTTVKDQPNCTLGDTVEDAITHYSGVAYIKQLSISGCLTWWILPTTLDAEGRPRKMDAFDNFHVRKISEADARYQEPAKQKAESAKSGPTGLRVEMDSTGIDVR